MCKYRVRWFYSKRAFLILAWTFLVSFVNINLDYVGLKPKYLEHYIWVLLVLAGGIILLFTMLLSGWLADTKFGNYKVVKFGVVVTFIGSVLHCSLYLILNGDYNSAVATTGIFISSVILGIGAASFGTTSLQLGLDQMPDASSTSISSFIAWYVSSLFASHWIYNTLETQSSKPVFTGIVLILPVFALSIVLISDYLLAKKWLIIEPTSPQCLKTIYKVIKFALKHKAPLNRSALTYWEEDIPSRIDLGKSKYGGPFTTEQVEDVKTVLRLTVITIPILIISSAAILRPANFYSLIDDSTPSSTRSIILFLMHKTEIWIVAGTFLSEFIIYPLYRERLPSILRRIGIASFSITSVSLLFLIANLVHEYKGGENASIQWVSTILYLGGNALSVQVIFTSSLELVCAQAPYSMRGLFAGWTFIILAISFVFGSALDGRSNSLTHEFCAANPRSCVSVLVGVKTAVSLFGFLLFCVLARWYKMRVRDEIYEAHRVIEEVYDRYLTSAASRYQN